MAEKLARNDYTALDEKQKEYIIYSMFYDLTRALEEIASALVDDGIVIRK